MEKKLTEKEKLFVKYYLLSFNGTQAAIKAGYSRKTAGVIASQNLTKLNIQREVKRGVKRIVDKIDLNQDVVLAELMKIAFADIRDYIKIGPKGIKIKDLEDVDTKAISSAGMRVTKKSLNVDFKMHNKEKALELLGRYLGMFVDKLDVSGEIKEKITIYLPKNKRFEENKKE